MRESPYSLESTAYMHRGGACPKVLVTLASSHHV